MVGTCVEFKALMELPQQPDFMAKWDESKQRHKNYLLILYGIWNIPILSTEGEAV